MQNRSVTAFHINLETKRVRGYYVGKEGEKEGNIDFDLRSRDVTIQELIETTLNADS